MDDFYAARSGPIPPPPWTTFSPPFSLRAPQQDRGRASVRADLAALRARRQGGTTQASPIRVAKIELAMAGATAVLSAAAGPVVVLISADLPTTMEARVIDGADTALGCSASATVNPGTESVLAGSFRDLTLAMS